MATTTIAIKIANIDMVIMSSKSVNPFSSFLDMVCLLLIMWLQYSRNARVKVGGDVDNSPAPSSSDSGQILVEVIIAIVVIALVAAAVTQVVTQSLRASQRAGSQNAAVLLAGETGEAVRMIAAEDWHAITALATSSVNRYYPTVSGGKWATSTGAESVVLNDITYARSFYVEEVFRSTATGDIVTSGGYRDPSTAKIVSVVTWTDVSSTTLSFSKELYLSRFLNKTYAQTDWSGGDVGEQLTGADTATTSFATSSSIDAATTPGSLQLSPQ